MPKNLNRGDTIIELVLAFAIFSLAAISTLTILNKGVSISQRSLEKSLVRQQVDAQAEIIRYLRDTENPKWDNLKGRTTLNPLSLSSACPDISQIGQPGVNGFFVVPDSSNLDGFSVLSASTPNYELPGYYAQVDYATKRSYGLWGQVALAENKSGLNTISAYDFYIQGCWDSVGQDVPMKVGTIVRLYDK